MANSYVEYTANGSTNQFDITFSYIDRTHLQVFVDNVEDTSFTFINDNRIQTSSMPANAAVVKIARNTPIGSRLVDFQDGSVLTEADLDKSADQNFFIAQETEDEVASKLGQNNAGVFDAINKRIINVATPTADTDAANKTYIDTQTNNAFTSATNAATSATNAATSASTASTKVTEATASATNAATSETNAATSATSAANSATTATTQASTATTKATEASTSASNASTSETNAANSATAAATSATNAANSATTATTQATNAANSATAAQTAQAAAEAAADNFDDTYLGAKASDPTVDNDGDALNAGDLYFNSTDDVLRVYTGSSWQNAAVDTTNFITLSGTQTVSNKTLTTPIINGATIGSADLATSSNGDISIAPNGTGKVVIKGNTNQGKIVLNCENNSHGQTIIAAPHSESASNTLTLPSTGGDARLVSATSTATLTNKTLTSPKINEDVAVTATASELNILDGATVVVGEINALDLGTTAIGTAIASKAVILDANKDYTGIRNISFDGTLGVSGISSFAVAANVAQSTLTSSSNSVAWDASAKPNAVHVTTENTTFAAPTNNVEGAFIALEINYNGSHTIAFNTIFEFAASTAPTFTSTDGKTDILVFRYNGAVWQEVGRTLNLSES